MLRDIRVWGCRAVGYGRSGIRGSVCTAAILSCACPLWVLSGHRGTSDQCPLCLRKRTSEPAHITFDAPTPAAWRYSPRSAALQRKRRVGEDQARPAERALGVSV
jgi:hypothetical protein